MIKDPNIWWDLVHDGANEGEDLLVLAEIKDLRHDETKESPRSLLHYCVGSGRQDLDSVDANKCCDLVYHHVMIQ
eukprot:7127506-Ditylum_brightwellii.AAC.1